jgi:hypothetical protein
MTDKLPAPCEHCAATGIFHGSECIECRGKGYWLMIDGRLKWHRHSAAGLPLTSRIAARADWPPDRPPG